MRNPGFGETNLGALSGAVVGAIGGLFAIGISKLTNEVGQITSLLPSFGYVGSD